MQPAPTAIRQAMDAFHSIAGYLRGVHGPEWLDVDLTISQLRALKGICTEGPIHGRGLAHALSIGQPAVSKLVDQLVERGLVQRAEDRGDRRIVWLRPTDAGRALFERISLGGHERIARLLETLDDDELACVCRALDILKRAAERLTGR